MRIFRGNFKGNWKDNFYGNKEKKKKKSFSLGLKIFLLVIGWGDRGGFNELSLLKRDFFGKKIARSGGGTGEND